MTADANLSKKYSYKGEPISVKSLETTIATERDRQNVNVEKLTELKAKNEALHQSLTDEIKRLRKVSDFFSKSGFKGGFSARIKEILSYLPGLRHAFFTKRSIEDLLKQQYEISTRRVKEAADYSDRLKAAEQDLFKEIERLNRKIIESAQNEETAAGAVLDLKEQLSEKRAAIESKEDKNDVAYRRLQAEADELNQALSEHSTLLELYASAEDRLARLKENTGRVQQTMTNLYTDIRKYVLVASEKLDEAAAQIQAVGTAADASIVLIDMKTSLDAMTRSMNETTQFVSETQLFLRENLDNLLGDLEMYDSETQKIMQTNLERSRNLEKAAVDRAVEKALKIRERKSTPPTSP